MDAGGAFIITEWIRLIVPIEVARIGTDGMIGVLGGLMVGEEAVRISVKSAAFRIIPQAGEKTSHLFGFLIAGVSDAV
jgi:hypothetical protein